MKRHAAQPRTATMVRVQHIIQLLLLVMLLVPAIWPALARADPATTPSAGDPFADVIPSALAPAARFAATLSDVSMAVTLDPIAGTIGGELTVTWRNPAPEPLAEVWFRLFPNAGYYGAGNLAVANVTVDGAAVAPELALDDTALRVPLPEAVASGASAEIAMTFTTTIPADSTGSYGIFSHDTEHDSWVLADWYPLLAVHEDVTGWALPPVTPFGDPTYAPGSFFDVQITAPADLEVVATGVVTAETAGTATVTHRYIAGPARDFVIVADDDNTPLSRAAGETELTLWTAPDLAATTSERTIDIASDALRYYTGWLGPYPARSVDLVQIDPNGALGIAWSGLLFLDGPALLETTGAHDEQGLASIVAHEISHLWWGIMVGGDSNAHGYIQEGLATVSSLLFIQDHYGAEAAATALEAWTTGPARRLLKAGDAIVDVPAAAGQDEVTRSAAIYGKGSLGFLAIRQQIGPEAFAAALRDIASRYAWGEMTPEQLRAAFERASDQDLTAFWSHWFDEAAMTQEEIDAITGVIGS